MIRTVACVASMMIGCMGVQQSATAQRAAAPADGAMIVQTGMDPAVFEQLNLSRYTVQSLATPADNLDPWSVEVVLDGQAYVLDLQPYSLRSDHFQLLVQGPDGVLRLTEPPAVMTAKGEVRGVPGSAVRGSLVAGGVELLVTFDNGSAWGVQPLSSVDARAPHGVHVVYSTADTVDTGGVCGGAVVPPGEVQEEVQPGLVLRGVANKICEIAVDSDVEFFTARGSVANAVNDIENTMNSVESIYENNTGVTIEVTTIVIRTANPDPYTTTNSGTFLTQFATEWGNSVYAPIRRDLTHLMTGKSMSSGVLGIAYLSVVCGTNKYGLSQRLSNSTQRYAVVAHEIGHNFSADHCNSTCSPCQIMCAGLGGCSGILTSFSTCEAGGIAGYADSRSPACLPSQPASIAAPFSDSFPSTTIDTNKWVYNKTASITTAGVGEPSSPNSLELDASGNGLYQDDEIRSHFIQMSGVASPILRYWAQARGVPSGKQLFVEVWTSQLRWVVKNTITSDGVDDPNYTQFTHTLSGVELHNEFRVRFRVDVDSGSQNWFIDDVYVGTNSNPPTGSCCVAGVCNISTQAMCAGTWTEAGSCSPNPCEQPTGACCVDGVCSVTTAAGCAGTWTAAAVCSPNPCEVPTGACCFPSSSTCFILSSDQCNASGGTYNGNGSNCSADPCLLPTGACCLENGSCMVMTAFECDENLGDFQGTDTPCDMGTCAPQTGACCLTDTCIVASAADCANQGGSFSGIGTDCLTACQPETGSCCLGVICVITTSADCGTQGGAYGGPGTPCNDAGNNTQPCCRADFDLNGAVEVPDIFAFLSAWFAGSATADFDGGGIGVPDIFGFLSAWFAGCGE